MSAPYFDITTPTPAWGRLLDNNTIQLDARGGGLIAGITPQTLLPHGETVSILTSAYVKSTLVSTRNGFEGIGHSLQGFVKGPTGSPVRVYDNKILTNGDPAQWINDQLTDYRRVTFVDQMPDNVNPEWMESTWFTKGTSGQTNLRNMEFRDHYSRRYRNAFSPASWTGFSLQYHPNFILGRGASMWTRYLQTIVMRIAKGQPVSVTVTAYLELAGAFDIAGVRSPVLMGVALKLTRRDDGVAEWWNTPTAATPATGNEITDVIIDQTSTFEADSAYSQIEIVVWVLARNRPSSELSSVYITHDGIEVDVVVNDSIATGSE